MQDEVCGSNRLRKRYLHRHFILQDSFKTQFLAYRQIVIFPVIVLRHRPISFTANVIIVNVVVHFVVIVNKDVPVVVISAISSAARRSFPDDVLKRQHRRRRRRLRRRQRPLRHRHHLQALLFAF